MNEHGDGFSNLKESVLTEKKYQTSTTAESTFAETPNDMAKQIADLLNTPNLPTRISDAIQEGLNEFYNCDLDWTKFSEHLTSPEYIARLLSMAK